MCGTNTSVCVHTTADTCFCDMADRHWAFSRHQNGIQHNTPSYNTWAANNNIPPRHRKSAYGKCAAICVHNWDSAVIHQEGLYGMQVKRHVTEQSVKESSNSFWDCLFVLALTHAWSGHLSGSAPAVWTIHSEANRPERKWYALIFTLQALYLDLQTLVTKLT